MSKLGDIIKLNGRDHIVTQDDLDRWNAKFMDMLESQQAPDANSDREFVKGKHTLRDSYDGTDEQFDHLIKSARAKGYEPKTSDIYYPRMVSPEVGIGDPLAFAPGSDAKSHIKKVCEMRNQSCNGAVVHKRSIPDRDPWSNEPKKKKTKVQVRKTC